MKRLGFRSAFVSPEEKVEAGTKPSQTTEPQLFYIVCPVFFYPSFFSIFITIIFSSFGISVSPNS